MAPSATNGPETVLFISYTTETRRVTVVGFFFLWGRRLGQTVVTERACTCFRLWNKVAETSRRRTMIAFVLNKRQKVSRRNKSHEVRRTRCQIGPPQFRLESLSLAWFLLLFTAILRYSIIQHTTYYTAVSAYYASVFSPYIRGQYMFVYRI